MRLSDATPPVRKRQGYDCAMGAVWPRLDDDDRTTLAHWLTDPDVSDRWVAEQLARATGARITYQQVARHRRNDCTRCADDGRTWT